MVKTDESSVCFRHPQEAAHALHTVEGKAAVFRRQPFTIILNYDVAPSPVRVEFKADPGSRTTGLALVAEFAKRGRTVIFAANLHHRGQAIRANLESRRSRRRGRRGRKTRYRKARFLNRVRPAGWLPPSVQSRVDNVAVWYGRLNKLSPLSSAAVETVRFDMQALVNPEISGIEYQQGELAGYELREFLLEKWGRRCAYCGKENVPLEIEHIHPKSRGGSDRVSNLTLACRRCNEAKGNRPVEAFLADRPEVLKRILAQAKAPLKDAAAVNSTRFSMGNVLKAWGLPVTFWSGGRTKLNRTKQGYQKDHWIDAACVGETGAAVAIPEGMRPLQIKATGRGIRQVVRTDKHGFPRNKAGRCKRVNGFQTGDWVRLVQPKGKYTGEYFGRLAGVRTDGRFDIKPNGKPVTANWRNFSLIQRGDGYDYAFERAA